MPSMPKFPSARRNDELVGTFGRAQGPLLSASPSTVAWEPSMKEDDEVRD